MHLAIANTPYQPINSFFFGFSIFKMWKMKFSVFFIVVFSAHALFACLDGPACEICVSRSCTSILLKNQTKICRAETVEGSFVVFTATSGRHCKTMNRISKALKVEVTTTTEVSQRVFFSPQLLPLPSIDDSIPIVTTTEQPTTTDVIMTTTTSHSTQREQSTVRSTPPPPTISTVSDNPKISSSSRMNETNSTNLSNSSLLIPTGKNLSSERKQQFTFSNRNGVAVMSKTTIQTNSKSAKCKSMRFADTDMFERAPAVQNCSLKVSVVELYLRALCNLAQLSLSSPLSYKNTLVEADRIFLQLNAANHYNHTCSVLLWRKRFCLNEKRIKLPKKMEWEKRRRVTNFFKSVSMEACKNGKLETRPEIMARLICRAKQLSTLISMSEFSHYDYAFVLMIPTQENEHICSQLFSNRMQCYNKSYQ